MIKHIYEAHDFIGFHIHIPYKFQYDDEVCLKEHPERTGRIIKRRQEADEYSGSYYNIEWEDGEITKDIVERKIRFANKDREKLWRLKGFYGEGRWKIWLSEWGHYFASNGSAILTSATKENIYEQIREYNKTPKQSLPDKYQVKFKDSIYKGSNQ